MPMLERDGADLYYETHGSGPALIFAHGLGGNHLSWWQQVPAFRDAYTCITFAHRGFWPSTAVQSDDLVGHYADDLAALIDHLGLAEVRLVAQSMGGWTCLAYALSQPERVRALVLASTTGTFADPDAGPLLAAVASRAAAAVARGVHPAVGERMTEEQPALTALYRQIDALSTGLDKEAVRASLGAHRTAPPQVMAHLRVPLLCITGEEDVVIPSEAVVNLARTVPNARLHRIARTGHSTYFERPNEFNEVVRQFLAEVDAEAPDARLERPVSR